MFFFNDTAATEIYALSLHDALPIFLGLGDALLGEDVVGRVRTAQHRHGPFVHPRAEAVTGQRRSEEHTSELQSRQYLVCRLLLEKNKSSAHMLPHILPILLSHLYLS